MHIPITKYSYLILFFVKSEKYLAVIDVKLAAVVKHAQATIIPNNIVPKFPNKPLVIVDNSSV